MIFNFQPSNSYLRIQSQIPEDLKSYELVVIHYITDEFKCDRWTTRTRDILKKHAKMLQFDPCHAYLMEPSRFIQFITNINASKEERTSFMFLGFRLSGSKWISTVDKFDYRNISSIEHHGHKGDNGWII